MGAVLERLKREQILVSDGAWGTLLQSAGLSPGECPEEWNLSRPEAVGSIAAAYAEAGSDIVLTNSFGGSPVKLKAYGLENRTRELNREAARLSCKAAAGALVAGSVGPTGEFLAPLGILGQGEAQAAFEEQIAALLEGGVHGLCIETMTALEEAVAAVRAARALDAALDIMTTMTFDASAAGFRTMMGVDISSAVRELTRAGADILGANCGNGIEQMLPIVEEFRAHTDKPILVHANAGLPEMKNGEVVFRQTPADMASTVEALLKAGCRIVGGCCGTTPDHIRSIRSEVDRLHPR